jgi:hypothetical protein
VSRPCSIRTLEELARFVDSADGGRGLFVRWTPDPDGDVAACSSRDELTGVTLPGLSANPLAMEPWWDDRPLDLWLARRLYDYQHLAERRGKQTRPYLFRGREVGRGPDNEPLICDAEIVAVVESGAIEEASRMIDELPADWGTLDRIR